MRPAKGFVLSMRASTRRSIGTDDETRRVLKALDVQAEHWREAMHRHLLDSVLRAAAAAAHPALGSADALRPHKALQAPQQAHCAVQLLPRPCSCPLLLLMLLLLLL